MACDNRFDWQYTLYLVRGVCQLSGLMMILGDFLQFFFAVLNCIYIFDVLM